MSTTATLESPQVRLDAGGEAVVPLHIRNNGPVVEGYRIEVVGVPAEWTTVEPAQVSLYPGDTGTATLAFHPPRTSAIPAGDFPFGVRVVPTERPDETVVPEGVVEVLPFLETTAELIPRTSHGRRTGKHQIAVDNRGNVPVSVLFGAADPGNRLTFDLDPEALTVEPGNAVFADLKAHSTKAIWRGTPLTHPFGILVTPHSGQTVTLDGAYLQEPIVPKWLVKTLLALIAVLLLLALLWFTVLKPTIKSAAKDAVKKPLAKASSQAAAAQKQATTAQQAAQVAAAGNGGSAAPAKTAPAKPGEVVAPFWNRLAVKTAKGADRSVTYSVRAKTTLRFTDLVYENPQGDFGKVTLMQGNRVLYSMALENFREYDYHSVSPVVVTPGQSISLVVHCTQVGKPVGSTPTQCDTALFMGGTTARRA